MIYRIGLCVALALWLPGAALLGQINIIQVPRDYTDINAAIAAAGLNGQVILAPGVYDRTSQTFPIVIPHNLIFRGSGTHLTIIDGSGAAAPAVRVSGMNSTFFGLFDFTIRNASHPTSNSAGLLIANSPRMTVEGLRLVNNRAPLGVAGGLLIDNASPTIRDSEFKGNAALSGGGVCIQGGASNPSFLRCTFLSNAAGDSGGGVLIRDDALGEFDECRFESNSAVNSGGAFLITSTTGLALGAGPSIAGARFLYNDAARGGAISLTNHQLTAAACEFLENNASINGGALFSGATARLDLDRSHIARNTVDEHIFVIEGAGDITNNMFYRNTTGSGGVLRFEGAGVTARVVHNTFAYNNIGGPLHTGVISQFRGTPLFQNNIVAFNDAVGYAEADFNSDPIFRYNLFWANTEGGYLDENISILSTEAQFLLINNPQPAIGMVLADPQFRDAGVNNYHLGAGSPARDAGQTVAGIPTRDIDDEERTADAAGTAPDMGADEQLAPVIVTSAFWFDKAFNGIADQGDELVLQFSEPVQINAPLFESDFALPVSGDSLGSGYTAAVNLENPTQLVITLGDLAQLTIAGEFDSGTLAPGSPSGIEIAASPRAGVLVSARTGLTAHQALSGGGARDLVVSLEPQSVSLIAESIFPQVLPAGPGGYFTKTRLDFPPGSLLYPVVLLMAPRFEFAGALSAMQISEAANVTVIHPEKPVKITMQYEPLELNSDAAEFENRLRIFVRRQSITGAYQFLPVIDAYGGAQQVDMINKTISVYTTELIPQDINFAAAASEDGVGEVAVQANKLAVYLVAPLDVMPSDTERVSPASAAESEDVREKGALDADAGSGLASVIVEPAKPLERVPEVYYNHQLELPNFDAANLSPLGVTFRTTANRFEREEFERTGLPATNFSVTEIISWNGSPDTLLEFIDEATLRQEYQSHPERDLRDERGQTASPAQLRLLQYDPQQGFATPAAGTPLLQAQSNRVEWQGLLNPAPAGRGIYALIADASQPLSYAFDFGEEGWRQQDAPRFFVTPNFISGGGRLGLGSRGLNTFGAWLSPENFLTVQPDVLLISRFNVSSNISNPAEVPSMRLRLNAENLDSALVMQLISDPQGVAIPTSTVPIDYMLIYEPPFSAIGAPETLNGVGAAFDITHFDPFDSPSGQVFLEHFETRYVDKKSFDAGFAPARTYSFALTTEGWVQSGMIGGLTPPISGYDFNRGALYMQASNATTFGFWTTDSGVQITTGTVYRISFTVASDEGNSALQVPSFRLRASDGMSVSATFDVNSATGLYAPRTIPQTYQLYYYPPEEIAAAGRSLILGWDILNFNPDDDADIRLFLDRVVIEQRLF